MSKLSAAFRKLTGTKLSDVFGGILGGGKTDADKAAQAAANAKNAGFFGTNEGHVLLYGGLALAAVGIFLAMRKK